MANLDNKTLQRNFILKSSSKTTSKIHHTIMLHRTRPIQLCKYPPPLLHRNTNSFATDVGLLCASQPEADKTKDLYSTWWQPNIHDWEGMSGLVSHKFLKFFIKLLFQ